MAGEPNPYPADVPAVRRQFRAVPVEPHPVRRLFLDVGGSSWVALVRRHRSAVVGHAWVRRSSLVWRRAAWSVWVLGLVASAVVVELRGNEDERVVRDFSGELFVLFLAAVLLVGFRVRAVVDPDDGAVGVRG